MKYLLPPIPEQIARPLFVIGMISVFIMAIMIVKKNKKEGKNMKEFFREISKNMPLPRILIAIAVGVVIFLILLSNNSH